MHDAASEPSWTAPPVVLADRAELAHAAGLLSEAADLAEEAWLAQRVGRRRSRGGRDVAAPRPHRARPRRQRAWRWTSLRRPPPRWRRRVGCRCAARRRASRSPPVGSSSNSSVTPNVQHAAHGHDRLAVECARERRGAFVAIGPPRRPDRRRRDRAARGTPRGGRTTVPARRARPTRLGSTRTCIITSRPRSRTARRPARSTTVASRRRGRSTRPGVRCKSVYELRGDWGASTRLLTRVALVPLLDRGDAEGAILWLERLRRLSSPSHDERLLQTAAQLRAVWLRRREAGARPRRRRRALDRRRGVRTRGGARRPSPLGRRRRSHSACRRPPPSSPLSSGTTQLEWIVALPAGAWTIKLTSRRSSRDEDRS